MLGQVVRDGSKVVGELDERGSPNYLVRKKDCGFGDD